jgi:hypothetical protein
MEPTDWTVEHVFRCSSVETTDERYRADLASLANGWLRKKEEVWRVHQSAPSKQRMRRRDDFADMTTSSNESNAVVTTRVGGAATGMETNHMLVQSLGNVGSGTTSVTTKSTIIASLRHGSKKQKPSKR